MPANAKRKIIVRTYVHFEGEEAPGYFVDGQEETVRIDPIVARGDTLPRFVGMIADVQATRLMRRFLDPKDPDYGAKT